MGNQVFVCYARRDSGFVLQLATNLKSRGIPVWLDQWDIPLAEDWDRAIDAAILDCAKFLIILSPHAVASHEVRGELRAALDAKKLITPILYQPCDIPRQLRNIQYVDFSLSGPTDEVLLQRVVRVLEGSWEQHGGVKGLTEDEEKPKAIVPSASQPRTFTNSIGIEFILISAGEFLMGSENGKEDEKPVHRVQISKPFYLGKYPVTQDQWQEVMGNNPSGFKGDPNRPVENVSWNDTQEFLRKLSAHEGEKSYRLPTEAEWEYSCRAGSTGKYCFGDNEALLREYGWTDTSLLGFLKVEIFGIRAGTHPVGQLKPNAWGLYDMHGNVWEWVQDWYDANYYQRRPNPDVDPQGPKTGRNRVLRGGCSGLVKRFLRCACRSMGGPHNYSNKLGFRLVVRPS